MIYRLTSPNSSIVPKDSIAIDTNVLLWTFYDNISFSQSYQKSIYPTFLENILSNTNSKIFTSVFNIFEAFNIIEETEYKIYLQQNNNTTLTKKQYRTITSERQKIMNKLKLVFSQISSAIDIIEFNITDVFATDFMNNYTYHKYDIFDFALIKCCIEKGIKNILTDDADFSNNSYLIKNLDIITANKNCK